MQTTGKIGDSLLITGEGLYDITSVIFSGGASGDFSEYNNSIRTVVPEFAAWGYISIGSNFREVTGVSEEKFVPEPIIIDFFPTTGLPSGQVTLYGRAFSGVSGVSFNNRTGLFTVLSNTGILVTVPTGNTFGTIRVFGQSGLSATSVQEFSPTAMVTGLSSYAFHTGNSITIKGINFIPEILYEVETNKYLVAFGGNTGTATRSNDTTLVATVPYTAVSGKITVFRDFNSAYQSEVYFDILNEPPVIDSIYPSSGAMQSSNVINGSNFFDVTDVRLSGNGNDVSLIGTGTVVSVLGNSIFFHAPNISAGNYDVIIRTDGGHVTGSGAFTILDIPLISGFSPAITTTGNLIRVTGNNLYPFSTLFLNDTNDLPISIESGGSPYNEIYIRVYNHVMEDNTLMINNTVGTYSFSGYYLSLVYPPQIFGFSPSSGLWGDVILISGSGLSHVDTLTFYSGEVSGFNKVGSTGIYFIIPTGSFNSSIELQSTGGFAVSTGSVNVFPKPVIVSGFTPSSVVFGGEVLLSGLYMNTVTGVTFTGNGVEVSGFFTAFGTTGLTVTVPYPSFSGKISLYNKYARTQTSTDLNVLQSPIISNFINSGVYMQLINFSGQYLTNSQVFFKSVVPGEYVPGIETVILSDTSGRTKIPREIITDAIYSSGNGYLVANSGTFTPLPSITGFVTTSITNDSYIWVTGVNAYEVSQTGMFIRNGGIIYNFVDTTGDVSINRDSTATGGFTVISGKVGTNLIGAGPIAIASIYNENIITAPYNSNQFTSANLTINIGVPFVSGQSSISGGYPNTIYVTGHNFKTLYQVVAVDALSNPYDSTNLVVFDNDRISFQLPIEPVEGTGQVQIYNLNTQVQINPFIFHRIPVVSGFSPTRNITGRYFRVSGLNLRYANDVKLTNTYGNSVSAPFSVYSEGGSFIISGQVPIDIKISDQDLALAVFNMAGSGVSTRAMQILNIRDVQALEDLEMQVFLSSPNRGVL